MMLGRTMTAKLMKNGLHRPEVRGYQPMEKSSVYVEGEQEALRYKWIESEKAGCDLGEAAIRRWVQCHWWGYLRARWLEHLQGRTFWIELDHDDFGLLQREFQNAVLIEVILAGVFDHRAALDAARAGVAQAENRHVAPLSSKERLLFSSA